MGRKRINWKYEDKDDEKDEIIKAAGGPSPALLFEQRVLAFVTAIVLIGALVLIGAIATDYWIIVVGGTSGIVLEDKRLIFLWSYSGLWRRCDVYANIEAKDVHLTKCSYHPYTTANYLRTELVFVVILLILIITGISFSVYSLFHPRYTYKRVAAAVHLLTACMIFVVIELVESEGLLRSHEADFEVDVIAKSRHFFGYSYLLAWVVFILFIMAGVAFFAWSKKRKHLNHDLETTLK